jgi:hypothetical protein
MTISDLKIYLLNMSTLAISMSQIDMILKLTLLAVSIGYTILAISMSQIDMILKLTLLAVSIGYTIHKWWLLTKNKNKK